MYQLRCSSYIVKPIDFHQFVRVIQAFTDYWLTVVVLPPKPSEKRNIALSQSKG
jgi:two-component system response regulator